MTAFEERLRFDRAFKETAQEFFGAHLRDQAFFRRVGVEEKLKDVHGHIRHKRDVTTEFTRYAPDGFVCWREDLDRESLLIEFKTARTGFKLDTAAPLREMRLKIPDLKKEEVAGVELGSFNNLLRLRSVGVCAVIWLYAPFHLTSKWLAIVPEAELNLKTIDSAEMRRTRGSRTPIANLFVRVDGRRVFDLSEWISQEFELSAPVVRAFFNEKEQAFHK